MPINAHIMLFPKLPIPKEIKVLIGTRFCEFFSPFFTKFNSLIFAHPFFYFTPNIINVYIDIENVFMYQKHG